MLTARERTRGAVYSEAAPRIHSIKNAKQHLEKGDTATAFPTRSQTSPRVIHHMQGGMLLLSRDRKKKKKKITCRGGNTYLNLFFCGGKKIKIKSSPKEPVSSTLSSTDASERRLARASGAAAGERGRGGCGRAPFPGSRNDNARTPPPRHSRQL